MGELQIKSFSPTRISRHQYPMAVAKSILRFVFYAPAYPMEKKTVQMYTTQIFPELPETHAPSCWRGDKLGKDEHL